MVAALVISHTVARFVAARDHLNATAMFAHIVHMPAHFVQTTPECRGTTGLQSALLNAYSTIVAMNHEGYNCVFEDDARMVSGQRAVAEAALASPTTDVLYLGDCGGFACTHAMCMTREGALRLRNVTSICLRDPGQGTDLFIAHACKQRRISCRLAGPSSVALYVSKSLRFRGPFYQDRVYTQPLLHTVTNRFITAVEL